MLTLTLTLTLTLILTLILALILTLSPNQMCLVTLLLPTAALLVSSRRLRDAFQW